MSLTAVTSSLIQGFVTSTNAIADSSDPTPMESPLEATVDPVAIFQATTLLRSIGIGTQISTVA